MCFFAFSHIYLLFRQASSYSFQVCHERTLRTLFLNNPYEFQKISEVISSQHGFLQGCLGSNNKKGKKNNQHFLENRSRLSAGPSQSVLHQQKHIGYRNSALVLFLCRDSVFLSGAKKPVPALELNPGLCGYLILVLTSIVLSSMQGLSSQPATSYVLPCAASLGSSTGIWR